MSMAGSLLGKPERRHAGFTLVEVLVALVIVALVLGAALRASGSLATAQQRLTQQTYAGWSADNRLSEIRLARLFPNPGRGEAPCPQANLELVCVEEVFATANPAIRRIDILVYAADNRDALLLRRTAFAANLPPFPVGNPG